MKESKVKKVEELKLHVEELEERIAPGVAVFVNPSEIGVAPDFPRSEGGGPGLPDGATDVSPLSGDGVTITLTS
ncbi:hypothetical protein MYX84_12100 [Acidobacteria bacterium AH-259-O06]|nr:hypothetical protein [Acidobacteria bacterium AH-259-O06]